jgi:hypothetical protein
MHDAPKYRPQFIYWNQVSFLNRKYLNNLKPLLDENAAAKYTGFVEFLFGCHFAWALRIRR